MIRFDLSQRSPANVTDNYLCKACLFNAILEDAHRLQMNDAADCSACNTPCEPNEANAVLWLVCTAALENRELCNTINSVDNTMRLPMNGRYGCRRPLPRSLPGINKTALPQNVMYVMEEGMDEYNSKGWNCSIYNIVNSVVADECNNIFYACAGTRRPNGVKVLLKR